jgi:hypothetical protein
MYTGEGKVNGDGGEGDRLIIERLPDFGCGSVQRTGIGFPS